MSTKSRFFRSLLTMLSLLGLLVACGAPPAAQPPAASEAGAAQQPAASQAAQNGEVPELQYHFAASSSANALKDQAQIEEAINAILVPKIGARLKLNPYGFTEAGQKITLLLQGGEPCDLVSVSGFVPYIPAVGTGGLQPLDDLLPQYAPNLWQRLKPEWWNAARVGGKIYNTPIYNGWTSYAGFWARSDLIEKYNFDWENTDTWEDWEPLFDQIVENEDDVTPLLSSDYWGKFWYPSYYGYDEIDGSIGSGPGGSLLGVKVDDTSRKVQLVLDTPEYRQAIELARKWYTKGYVSKDIVPDNEMIARRSQLKYGAFMFPGTGDFSTKAMADTEWAGVPILTKHLQDRTILTTGIGRTGYAVCATSEYPDLAVKYIEEVNQNPDLLNLLNYGIEGTHWEWKDEANKVIGLPEGQTLETATWVPNTYWQFGDRRNLYLTDPTDIGVWDRIDAGINRAIISPLMGFTFDPQPVANEIAQVNTVAKEYEGLNRGMVEDIDGTLAEFKSSLQQAGIDAIVAEVQRQIDEWAKTQPQ